MSGQSNTQGQIRRSQVITTWGPGALLDLPLDSVIMGGLDTWPRINKLEEIMELRLMRKVMGATGVQSPRFYAPPGETGLPWLAQQPGIGAYIFPNWFLVQEKVDGPAQDIRSRRLIPRKALDERGKFDNRKVVPIRFVRACPLGHIDDINWRNYVHSPGDYCSRPELWLDEHGTSGDLGDLVVRCLCGKERSMSDAMIVSETCHPLGHCNGNRPWLGDN
ncbi:hypothetical protein K8T06_10965, partial [bacterium]|nr:hypothetical protein [bacterium]